MLTFLKKLLILTNIVACISCISLAFYFILLPRLTTSIYAEDYKEKMSNCDSSMRNHLIAKNRVKFEKSIDALKKLETAEVSLVHCHEYDMLRKKMLSFGLSPNDLARLGLEAIEEKEVDLENLVKTHEFKY